MLRCSVETHESSPTRELVHVVSVSANGLPSWSGGMVDHNDRRVDWFGLPMANCMCSLGRRCCSFVEGEGEGKDASAATLKP